MFSARVRALLRRRTLHTAQDAVDEKWVTQLWLSCGLPPRPGQQQAQGGVAVPAFVRGVNGAKAPPLKGRQRSIKQ